MDSVRADGSRRSCRYCPQRLSLLLPAFLLALFARGVASMQDLRASPLLAPAVLGRRGKVKRRTPGLPRPDGDWHEWTQAASASRAAVRFPKEDGTMYFFIHVPKAGGASFETDALWHFLPNTAGFLAREECYRQMKPLQEMAKRASVESRFVMFLRRPEDQVLSMYHECRDSPWGQKHFVVPELSEWLQHFTDAPTEADFGCYHPANIQSRALACESRLHHAKSLHGTSGEANEGSGTDKPVVAEAIHALDSGIDFVGITEFYHESMCLFAEFVQQQLPPGCDRNRPDEWRQLALTHDTHGISYTRRFSDLTANESAMVAQLTGDDDELYAAALVRFRKEVQRVEQQYGVQILPPVGSEAQQQ